MYFRKILPICCQFLSIQYIINILPILVFIIFIKMALILLHVLPFQVLSFTKSNCCDFTGKDERPPIHLISIHWIIPFGSNAGVLSQAATKAKKTVTEFTDALKPISSAI